MDRNSWARNYVWKFRRVVQDKEDEEDLEKEDAAVISADTALQVAVVTVDSDNREAPVAQAVAIWIAGTIPAVQVPRTAVPEMVAATDSIVATSTTEREKVVVMAVEPVLAIVAAEGKVVDDLGL
ncbi:hypothetical protein AWZ03_014879, partial [Drosophila navojoa]